MDQCGLFDRAEVVDVTVTSPLGASLPPFQGTTPISRHSSFTGAQAARQTRSANLITLRALWDQPLTLQDVATLAHLPIASVCSLKAALDLEAVDWITVTWPDGRTSKRTRWQLRK